ncbi:piggyBac transposable element-derived protein 4-like [Schistocerca serialis cubense]|uniref:piggyBac transposable element-derived protein 4-like n=1 Tax=Schistocerca serialis cubense TaxID=2023355 RepID=UPI00214EE064|nr:piggyBac transposable element-derived protein 4-like [Schistocerca serialis cubense]
MLNRKEMSKCLKKAVLKKGEMTFRHSPHTMACKWKDTRDVAVLSSKHRATVSDPNAVLDYNINKTGVDRSDQLVAYYHFKKKSMKWWKKLFFHLFIQGIVNSDNV